SLVTFRPVMAALPNSLVPFQPAAYLKPSTSKASPSVMVIGLSTPPDLDASESIDLLTSSAVPITPAVQAAKPPQHTSSTMATTMTTHFQGKPFFCGGGGVCP